MTPRVRASVIVASRDRPDELQLCLASIRQAVTVDDEIIVVDSASADAEAVRRVAASSGARYIRTEMGGSAKARNAGIQHARGGIIAFTDDDARVEAGWLSALVAGFSDPAVTAVVGPVFELGSDPPALLIDFASFDASGDGVSFHRTDPDWFARVRYGAIGSGANLAVRCSAFERHGRFRESLGRGAPIVGDENYYLLTIVEERGTVVNEPMARVYHPPQSPARLKDLQRSAIAYFAYIFITKPQLRWRLSVSLMGRSQRNAQSRPRRRTSATDLISSLLGTPGLIISALGIDRITRSEAKRGGSAEKTGQRNAALNLLQSAPDQPQGHKEHLVLNYPERPGY
jgi:glycosyltransferase involved in cell wall biosynthesis